MNFVFSSDEKYLYLCLRSPHNSYLRLMFNIQINNALSIGALCSRNDAVVYLCNYLWIASTFEFQFWPGYTDWFQEYFCVIPLNHHNLALAYQIPNITVCIASSSWISDCSENRESWKSLRFKRMMLGLQKHLFYNDI